MQAHETLVSQQFGATARAYLESAVHARGQDLERLTALLGARPRGRVLDIGCGGGHASFAAAPVAEEVWATDLSADMLAVVAEAAHERGYANLHTRQAAADLLPFADAAFDAVITRMSAHHWRDVPVALAEIHRVLKPDGVFLLIDIAGAEEPLCDTWLQGIELLRDPSHVRNHTPSAWRTMLDAAGFERGDAWLWRLPIAFDAWITRMRTPPVAVEAIRHLWSVAPTEVKQRHAVAADCSFELDALMMVATPARRAG